MGEGRRGFRAGKRTIRRPAVMCAVSVLLVATTGLSVGATSGGATTARAGATSCGAWTQVPSPNKGRAPSFLRGVASVGSDDVWAVGSWSPRPDLTRTLIEHWNGTRWSKVPSPNPGPVRNLLIGVAAAGPDDVWAVGWRFDDASTPRTLAVHWDGSSWAVAPTVDPDPGGAGLNAVVVVSPDEVWAVGGQGAFNAEGNFPRTLAERWDGSSWTAVPTPSPGGEGMELSAVTRVPGTDHLWAVGVHRTFGTHRIWTAFFDGTSWRAVLGPHLKHGFGLSGVAAVGRRDVLAVGWHGSHPLALRWDGTAWGVVSTHASGRGFLAGAARVPGTRRVLAVGVLDGLALVERWDGTRWSVIPNDHVGGEFRGVAVRAPGDTWAVGNRGGTTLAEHFAPHGTSVPRTPAPGRGANALTGVAAIAADDAWAVGSYMDGTVQHTLIEHWNGTRWRTVPSPDGDLAINFLSGVTALSPTNVWAVGSTRNTGQHVGSTLIEHWDGTRWTVSDAPDGGDMFAVAARSGTNVWAVGSDFGNPGSEHWNGAQWAFVPTPNLDAIGGSWFEAVAPVSRSHAWAAGVFYGNDVTSPLFEHWNGTRWSLRRGSDVGEGGVLGMAARSSSEIWAVGFTGDPFFLPRDPLVEQWDGNAWSQVSTPDPGSNDSRLDGVALGPGGGAWAVGSAGTATLAEHWDGSAWTIASTPAPGTVSALEAIARVPHTNRFWAVGHWTDGRPQRTLVEFRCG